MSYYVMVDDDRTNERGEALYEIHNCFEVGDVLSWRGGKFITESVPNPIRIEFEPFHGYSGPPGDLWDLCLPLMSPRLSNALLLAGVDNLQLFPAVLTNTETKEMFNYFVFNVVGVLSAADMARSDTESFDDRIADTSFFSLEIDEQKGRGCFMFRLVENINALVVHKHVHDFAVANGIPEARFAVPKDWANI